MVFGNVNHFSDGIMTSRSWEYFAVICIMLTLFAALACSTDEEDDSGEDIDAVAIELVVENDDFLGFTKDKIIGDIWFSDSVGPVGTPVEIVVQIDQWDRMDDDAIDFVCTMTLANPDLIKMDEHIIVFDIDAERVEESIIIPQVKTIPAVLDYEVVIAATNPNNPDDTFEAELDYQFLVNQGTPAT